jgi:hypothetical protein
MKILQYLFLLFILAGISNAQSQVLNNEQPVILHIDRSQYISGDVVLFEVFLYRGLIVKDAPGIEVFVDLINENGIWIDGTIVKQKDGIATGLLYLPDSLTSATYQLRAYTQFPDNNNYCFTQPIIVTNRFVKEAKINKQDTASVTIGNVRLNYISTDKEVYKTRQKVSVKLNLNRLSNSYPVNTTLRVINKKQWEGQMDGAIMKCINPNTSTDNISGQYNGILVHGVVIGGYSLQPMPNVVVLISCQDSMIRLKYDITDENGNFSFLLTDYYEINQFYFSAFRYGDLVPIRNAVIKIQPQFNQGNITKQLSENMPILPDSVEINKAIINKAYDYQSFNIDELPEKPILNYEKYIIGKVTDSVFIDDFIALNSFTEISKEILPYVKIQNKSGTPIIQAINKKMTPIFTDNPLILVDGVPLIQLDKIIDWGSSKIKWVQVQSRPRYYGNLILKNGIIWIETKKLDFWSQTSILGTYCYPVMGFQKPFKMNLTDYSSNSNYNLPDFRQTLLWATNIVLDSDNEQNISFYTSDEKGEFVIELFGISNDGIVFRDFKSIIVK